MSFEKSFCPSPWFHMRINNSGSYEYCRWRTKDAPRFDATNNIREQTPLTYFQNTMSAVRADLLAGRRPEGCKECYEMEPYNKVSGRQRQLLKVGIRNEYFEKTLSSSPLRADFDYSNANQGVTTRGIADWQIDLGNYCNGACVFCSPESSSRLATEFKQIGLIDETPKAAWCDDPVLVERFIQDLIESDPRYLHFIGGETLITPGFEKILTALVDHNIAKHITLGFTTNLTVWNDNTVDLLTKFKQVNLGMSVETLSSLNDYVRWPSKIDQVQTYLDQWVKLGKQHNWIMQLRITPTCLTVHELGNIYEYAWQHELSVESCNFITNPKIMRISVLPSEYRKVARDNLATWVNTHLVESQEQLINTRNPTKFQEQLHQNASSYLEYLDSAPDESYLMPELVTYLKLLETSRGNSILNYLPYEELFRNHGY
jgi:hypothetical protein